MIGHREKRKISRISVASGKFGLSSSVATNEKFKEVFQKIF